VSSERVPSSNGGTSEARRPSEVPPADVCRSEIPPSIVPRSDGPPPSVRFPRSFSDRPSSLSREDDALGEPPASVRFPRSFSERPSSLSREEDALGEAPASVRFPRSFSERPSSLTREDDALGEAPASVRFPRYWSELPAPPSRDDEALGEAPASVRFPRSVSDFPGALGREDEGFGDAPASVRFPRPTAEARAALGMREDEALGELPASVRFPSRRISDMRPPRPSDAPPPDFGESPASVRFQKASGEGGPGYRLREGACAVAVFTGDRWLMPSSIARLSPAAVWYSPCDGVIPRLGARVKSYLLGRKGAVGPIAGTVVSVDATGPSGGLLVGIQFGRVTRHDGREIIKLLLDLYATGQAELARSLSRVREQFDEPSRIRAVFRALQKISGEGLVVGSEVSVKAVEFIRQGDTASIAWESASAWGPPPYIVDMGGYNSIHRLHFTSCTRDEAGRMITPMPIRIERVRHRWFRRCKVRCGIKASFRHPIWPDLEVTGRMVLDVAFAGIGLEIDVDKDLVFPGLEIPDLELRVEGEEPLHMQGEVRYVLPARGETGARCGLKVAPRSAADDGPWMRLVSRELHAATMTDADASESIWSLLQQSGYFNLSGKSPDQFEPMKKTFLEFGARAFAAPRLICQAVWPSERGIEASLSVAKVYAGSWLMHQLAKRPGRAPGVAHVRQILRDVYLRALEYPQLDPGFRWAIAYIDGEVPWSMAHVDFVRPFVPQELAAVVPFRLLEGQSADEVELSAEERFEVGPAAPFEVAWLIDEIAKIRSLAYRESLDLVPERFDLAEAKRLWEEADMSRERVVLTARRKGVPVAAAILETGEAGTNLFRLLDCVRVFPLEQGGEASFPALIEHARAFYRERKKASFVFIQEYLDRDLAARGKFRDLGPGNYWALSAELIPELLEHVYELTAIGRSKLK